MPTITNYGDLVTTGNTTSQGTGSSTFAGSLGCAALTAASVSAGSGTISTSGSIVGGTYYGVLAGSNTISGSSITGTSISAGSGTISTSGSVAGGTLYGALAGSNTISASTVSATSLIGTHYGVLAGSNTISGTSITGTSVSAGSGTISTSGSVAGGTLYGVLAGSNTVSASSVSATSLVGTHYGVIAGSNTISGTSITGTSVSAGSGTISTSGSVAGGTLYGVLAGSNTISGTSITGTSVSAGSGTISTSGSVAGGTLYGVLAGSNTISGSSLSLSTALSIANGGTGATTAQTAINALVGGTATSGYYLRGNGTNVVMAGISAGDVPTLNQSTTGSAGSLSTSFTADYILYGTGTGVPAFSSNLTFTSNILTCSNDVVAYSDRNIKTDIEPILDALSKVSRIGGYTFTRTDVQSGRRTGVIAQEVREVLPEAVYETENGTLTVAYGNMVGLLIEAIKELREEVLELKKHLNTPIREE